MQNAKDTFYIALQTRLAALNPARTIVVRGVVRPGLLVGENELPTAAILPDCFRIDWTGLTGNPQSPLPLVALECTIRYCTDGTSGNGGMDRGRALAAMDAELTSAVTSAPRHTPKLNYAVASAGTPPVTMATNVFWSGLTFGPVVPVEGRLERTATLQVFAYQEAGEL